MPAASASGRVFISYRRQESSGLAGRLYDRLAAHLGQDQIFMDVDRIELGVDFAEVITQAVSACEVLLAVIGPTWLTATDQEGRRRLEDPDDIVHLEIAAALERDVRVIPILVEGAQMPRRQELPDTLEKLARRNALSVRHESFHTDTDRLLAASSRSCVLQRPPWCPRVLRDRSRRQQRHPNANQAQRPARPRPLPRPAPAKTPVGRASRSAYLSTSPSGD